MALPDLTGQYIQDTFQRIVQVSASGGPSGSIFTDGTGSLIELIDVTASYAISASVEVIKEVSSSYAETASLVIGEGSGSFSGSFFGDGSGLTGVISETASYVNPLNQDVIINGDLNVTGSFTASGLNYPVIDGEKGDVLVTDGEGNLTFERTRIYAQVKNVSGTTLQKGTPVHVSSSIGNLDEVIAASASVASTMPATFVLAQTLNDDEEGLGILTGFINGVDTSNFGEGDVVYVGANGGYTNQKPTGSNLIQNLGIVTQVAINGSGFIYGSGRANDIPNISPGYFWVGNSDSVATATPTSSIQNVVSSSYALQALSASYAVSSSYADTASFAQSGDGIFSGSFSGSYEGDGSQLTGIEPFPFVGDAVITGSLIVSGSGINVTSGSITGDGSGLTNISSPSLNDITLGLSTIVGDGASSAASYGNVFGKSAVSTGGQNVGIGAFSNVKTFGISIGHSVAGGAQTVAIGYNAGHTNGEYNVLIGQQPGNNTSGNYNISLGYLAGYDQTTGTGNITIGSGSRGLAGESNQLRIGHGMHGATISASLATGDIIFASTASAEYLSTPAGNLSSISASYALTASHALNAGGGGSTDTGSLLTTASVSLNTITFTKGDGSTFPITVDTGSNTIIPDGTVSSSIQISELGFVTSSATASFVLNSQTSSMSVATASYIETAQTASYVVTAQTASYVISSSIDGITNYVRNDQTSSMTVLSSSFAITASHALNAGGGTPTFIASGSTSASAAPNTGVVVEHSGSTAFSVIGDVGTLFSVDDDLNGMLFTANDISGFPVLQASASGDVFIGKSPQSLYTTAVISSTTAATTHSLCTLSTSSYDGAFFEYTAQSASNARAGNIMSTWNGSNIVFAETTTTDIGDTSDLTTEVIISGSTARLVAYGPNAGYKIKTIIKAI